MAYAENSLKVKRMCYFDTSFSYISLTLEQYGQKT